MIELLIYILIVLFLNFIIKKFNYLPNYSGQSHQLFTSKKKIPLTGGIFILILMAVTFKNNIILNIFFISIFLVGLTSDKNYLISPTKRIILQIIILTLFVFKLKLFINSTRLDFFDKFLENPFFSYIFVSFCILVLINGSNFVDGLNGLLIGYFLLIIFVLKKIGLIDQLIQNINDINLLIYSLLFLLLLNYINKFFLGDSGSYMIGMSLSYILITIYNLNESQISPYFIILLLWYPCFENLFSIIRKYRKKFSPMNADNRHLHQLIYLSLKKIVKINNDYLNTLSSVLINLYNFLIFYVSSLQPNSTKHQVIYILVNIFIYIILYLILSKKLNLSTSKK